MKERKGQTTIFVIIAVAIVAVALLIFLFYPNIKGFFSGESESPYQMFESCIIDDVTETINFLSLQGGSIEPGHYIVYNGENIEYLCYTNEFYKSCVMQQPMLKNHVEEEIKFEIKNKADECFSKVKESYEKKGYGVSLRSGETEVELLPKRIVISFNHTVSLVKGDTETYNEFKVVLNNNLYELVSITNSILNFEARYGDAETTTYMNYYHDLKVEKKKQIEGSTIYILSDRNNENKFQFASRSMPWPTGYS